MNTAEDRYNRGIAYGSNEIPPEWYKPSVDAGVLKDLMRRNNRSAALSYGVWFLLLGLLGYCAVLTWGHWYTLPVFLLYGTVFSMANPRWHESLHGTPFKTPVLNDIVYFITASMCHRDMVFSRWSHMNHHSYTIILEKDIEVAARPPVKPWILWLDFLNLKNGPLMIWMLIQHSLGIPSKLARAVVPRSEYTKMFWAARGALLLHIAAIVLSILLESWLPVLLFTLPRFYGGIFVWVLILSQHVGLAQDVYDHRLCARTIRLNPVISFFYMNMESHIEHHLFPSVPFHALPRLRELLAPSMPEPYSGLGEVYREMIPAVRRLKDDPDGIVRREVPENTEEGEAAEVKVFNGEKGNDAWYFVLKTEALPEGEAAQVEIEGAVLAVFHTREGFFAVDGLCTHQKAPLAGGLVTEDVVECPRHNARFRITTGEALRVPAKEDIATYPVRVERGKLYVRFDCR